MSLRAFPLREPAHKLHLTCPDLSHLDLGQP